MIMQQLRVQSRPVANFTSFLNAVAVGSGFWNLDPPFLNYLLLTVYC
jgi:hypothetical protein